MISIRFSALPSEMPWPSDSSSYPQDPYPDQDVQSIADGCLVYTHENSPTSMLHYKMIVDEHYPLCAKDLLDGLGRISSNLVSLNLNILPDNSASYSGNRLSLPRLEALTLNTLGQAAEVKAQLGAFLDLLCVPALHSLEVEVFEELSIPSLIERSECQLKSLTAIGTRWHDMLKGSSYWSLVEEYTAPHILLASWLSYMPDLETLTMIKVDLPPTLCRRLSLPVNVEVRNAGEDSSGGDNDVDCSSTSDDSEDKIVKHEALGDSSVEGDMNVVMCEAPSEVEGEVIESDSDSSELDAAVDDDGTDYTESVADSISSAGDVDEREDLCPNLRLLCFRQCRLDKAYRTVVRSFIEMLSTRMHGLPGSRGKLEEFHATSCRMKEVSDGEEVSKWKRDYNARLLFTE